MNVDTSMEQLSRLSLKETNEQVKPKGYYHEKSESFAMEDASYTDLYGLRSKLEKIFESHSHLINLIRSEMAANLQTHLQDLLNSSHIKIKAPESNPCFSETASLVRMTTSIDFQEEFNLLNRSRRDEIKALENYMGTKDNLIMFYKLPLNFFKWEALHKTHAGMPVTETAKIAPLTIQMLEAVIGAGYEKCKRLRKIMQQKIDTLFKDRNWSHDEGIDILYEISVDFNEYLNAAVYLDDELRPIKDTTNEATSRAEFDGVYTPVFSLYDVLLQIYKSICYKPLRQSVIQIFTKSIEQLLRLFLSRGINESNIYHALREHCMLKLREVEGFMIDMAVTQDTVPTVLLIKPRTKLDNTEELIKKLKNTFNKVLEDIRLEIDDNKFFALISLYRRFASAQFTPYISRPILSKLYKCEENILNDLIGENTESIWLAKKESLEKEMKAWNGNIRTKDQNVREYYKYIGCPLDN